MSADWCRKIWSFARRAALPALVVVLEAPVVLAGPEGGTVVGGSATISRPDAATTVINQASHNVAIDWDKFNIGANERVQFAQPGRSASALNRIFDQNPSQILGRLDANGRVVLLNPNGVFFGPNARVNVGALTAAGASLSDGRLQEFLDSGRLTLEALDATGGLVVNQGLIEAASGGSVTLAGKAVRNEGVVIASAGRVNLVAGNAMTLDFDGDGLMRFTIDEAVLDNAQALDEAVANSGSLVADGGEVLISAATARDVFDRAINNTGVIKAARIDRSGGVIRLVGSGPGSSVLNTGTLAATGAGATDGGSIHVLGEHVELAAGALVDASGDAGGGEVLIGGDYQGANPAIANAQTAEVADGAVIRADARSDGDGGKAIVWADGATRFHGEISARGGAQGGDGGVIEVSGRESLALTGTVDAGAPAGQGGDILFDPGLVTVCDGAVGAACGDDPGEVADNTIEGALTTGNVTVSTVDTDEPANPPDTAPEDINFDSDVSIIWTTANTLTLFANESVDLAGTLTGTTGTLNIDFAQSGAGATLDLSDASLALNVATITADGAGGTDTLIGPDTDAMWDTTAQNNGTLMFGGQTITFTSVGELRGGSGVDTFTIDENLVTGAFGGGNDDIFDFSGAVADPMIGGTIDGEGGTDTIIGRNAATTWALGTDGDPVASSITVTGGITSVENVTGGSVVDTFTITDWSNTVDGGGGNDNFNINAAAITAQLNGGDGDDDFTFQDQSASLAGAGAIDGGANNDLLDYQNFVATTVNVDIQSGTATNVAGGISNLEKFTGGGATDDSLTGADGTNTWVIAGASTLNGQAIGGFEILEGGSMADTFTFSAGTITEANGNGGTDTFEFTGGTVTDLDGGAATDTLDISAVGGADTVDLQNDTVSTGITNAYVSLETFIGDGAADILIAPDGGVTVAIFDVDAAGTDFDGVGDGTVTGGFTFEDFFTLRGGSGDDTFDFADGASIGGEAHGHLDGGLVPANDLGNDTLDWADVTIVSLDIGGNATGIGSTTVTGFENFVGNNTDSTLSGEAGSDDSFTLSGENDGVLMVGANSWNFTDFNKLDGEGAADTDTIDIAAVAPGANTVSLQDSTISGLVTGSFTSIEAFTGDGAADVLQLANGGVTVTVDMANEGTVTGGPDFTGFPNITGGTGGDTFNIDADLDGTAAGGDGSDTFNVSMSAQVGTQVDGGDGIDTLDFAGHAGLPDLEVTAGATDGAGDVDDTTATFDDPIAGGGDDFVNIEIIANVNAVVGSSGPNTWNITGVDAFTLNGVGYTGISDINGQGNVDTITIQDAGRMTGTIDGGGGVSDELIAAAAADFLIDAAAGGAITTGAGLSNFDGVEILTGSAANDSFRFDPAGTITDINGGTGTNTLDFDTGLTTGVSVTLTALGSNVGFAGTAAPIGGSFDDITDIDNDAGGTTTLTSAGGGVANVFALSGTGAGTLTGDATNTLNFDDYDELIGGGTATDNTLRVPDAATPWSIDALDGGTVLATDFTNIGNLTGAATSDDTFSFTGNAPVPSGVIDGRGETVADSLDFSANTAAATVSISDLNDIEDVVGSATATTDTLIGTDNNDLFLVTGANNAGSVDVNIDGVDLTFSNFEILEGGDGTADGDDTFEFDDGLTVTSIDGGDGTNTFDLSSYTAPITLTVAATDDTGTTDIGITAFANTGNVITGSANDTIDFNGAGRITGTIDGGGQAGNPPGDTLDYAGASGAVTLLLGQLTDIETVIGGPTAGDALVGDGGDNFFNVDAANTGFIDIDGSGSDDIAYSAFESIDGGAGNDEINNRTAGNVDVTLTGSDANGYDGSESGGLVSGGFDGIVAFVNPVNPSTSVLTGPNEVVAWSIDSAAASPGGATAASDTGTLDAAGAAPVFTFVNFGNITGGSNNDTFTIADNASGLTGNGGGIEIIGGGGTDTLIGASGFTNVFMFTAGSNSDGTLSVNPDYDYTGITNFAGGALDDDFVYSGAVAAPAGAIDGAGAGDDDEVDFSTVTVDVAATLGAGGIINVESVEGSASTNDTLTGSAQIDVFELTALNTGMVDVDTGSVDTATFQTDFDQFENLDAGAGNDTINFGDPAVPTANGLARLTGDIDGGPGAMDAIDFSGSSLAQDVDAAAGTIRGPFGPPDLLGGTFVNIESLTGNGLGVLDGPNSDTDWNVTGVDTGTYGAAGCFPACPNAFTNFRIEGGSGADNFFLNGGIVSGAGMVAGIDGGIGSNSITGDATANEWSITALNSGAVAGANGAQRFDSIQNISGGSAADDFNIETGGRIDGTLSGGSGGFDIVDYRSSAAGVVLDLTAETLTRGGTSFAVAGATLDAFIGGGGGDTVIGAAAGETITITNTGIIEVGTVAPAPLALDADIIAAGNSGTIGAFQFAQVENVSGGGGADTINLDVTGSLTGNLLGGAGDDQFNLDGGTLGGMLLGEGDNDTLQGENTDTTWTVNALDGGAVTYSGGTLAFSAVENLLGRAFDDRFNFTTAGALTGSITGAANGGATMEDIIDFSAAGVVVTALPDITHAGQTFSAASVERIIGSPGTDTAGGGAGADLFAFAADSASSVTVNGVIIMDDFENFDGGGGIDNLSLANDFGAPGANPVISNIENHANPGGRRITANNLTISGATSLYSGAARLVTTLTGLLSVTASSGDAFFQGTSGLALGAVDIGAANLDIFTSAGGITQPGSPGLIAGTLTLNSAGPIGAAADAIDSTATTLDLTTSAAGPGGNINVASAITGFGPGSAVVTDAGSSQGVQIASTAGITLPGLPATMRGDILTLLAPTIDISATALNISAPGQPGELRLDGNVSDSGASLAFTGGVIGLRNATLDGSNLTFNGTLAVLGDVILSPADNVVDFNNLGGGGNGNVVGGGNLAINPGFGTDMTIANIDGVGVVRSGAFSPSFTGHLIVGGLLNPLDPPASDATTTAINADTITVSNPLVTNGSVTLLATNISLDAPIGAGAPGGSGEITLLAVGDTQVPPGTAPGDITGPATGSVQLVGGRAVLIANNEFVNEDNIVLNLGGGDLLLAQATGAEDPNFSTTGAAPNSVAFDPNDLAFLGGLGLSSLSAVTIVFSNPAAALTALQNVQFIDTGVFEEELSLFGVIGTGVAMYLSQCEDLSGCAPGLTEEELDGIIAGLEQKIAARDAGSAEAAALQAELDGFLAYREELDDYLEAQEEFDEFEEFDDEFAEDFAEDFAEEDDAGAAEAADDLEPAFEEPEELIEAVDAPADDPSEAEIPADPFEDIEEAFEDDFELLEEAPADVPPEDIFEPEFEEFDDVDEFEPLPDDLEDFEELEEELEDEFDEELLTLELRWAPGQYRPGSAAVRP